jgi:hypothetical protein
VTDFRADDARIACPLFQAEYGGEVPTSALQLRISKIPTGTALTLNRLWHSRLPEIGNGWQCVAFGAESGNRFYAVALWSHPVARLLNGLGFYELRRMAIAPDAPKNTGSRMLRIMALLLRKERPDLKKLVSYHDTEVHTGCIYKAAGWYAVEKTDKRSRPWTWNPEGRPRNQEQTRAEKVRWQLDL